MRNPKSILTILFLSIATYGHAQQDSLTLHYSVENVVVSAHKQVISQPDKSGNVSINMDALDGMPRFGGAVDVVKLLQYTPGVVATEEGNTSLYVRGGDSGQSRMLINGTPLYSPSHLFGFFSVLNPAHLSGLTLYKSGIPAMYGSSTASVTDIRTHSYVPKSLTVEGNIGIIESDAAIHIPASEHFGIFLSAHPLDEWEFEVRELCNTTAETMNQFDAWASPAARNATTPTNNEDNPEKEQINPNQWMEMHAGQPLHIGGIIVAAEDRMSQKGNPWGKYTIEDYSGSYQFSAFGDVYQRFAALLKPNVYVYLTGVIQQRGAHMKWFKPKPIEEAEYEFALQQVQLIKDAQKDLRMITLHIPIENIQPDLIDELAEKNQLFAGDTPLRLLVFDTIKQNVITLNAAPIQLNKQSYAWLKEKQQEEVLTYTIN